MRQLILPGGREAVTRFLTAKKFVSLVENTHDKTVDFFQHEDWDCILNVSMKGDGWLSQYDQLDNKITDTSLVREMQMKSQDNVGTRRSWFS